MPKVFKIMSGEEVVKILVKLGFIIKTQKGSHVKLAFKNNNSEVIAIVPNHKTLKQGAMISIYKNALEIEDIDSEMLSKMFKN